MDAQTKPQSPTSPDWAARFLAGWNSRNTDRLLGLAADDVTWVDPFIPEGIAQGKAAVSEWLAATWSAFPDLTFEVAGEPFISIDGTQLAIAWKGAGTFTGRLEPAGVEPTGARVEMTGVDVYQFDGENLRLVVTETDAMSLAVQIGVVPAP